MRWPAGAAVLLSFYLAAAGPAAAQSASSLRQAVDAAITRSADYQASRGQVIRADSQAAAAQALWAAPPAVEVSHRNGRWAGGAPERETEVGVAVPVWMPGQRAARLSASEAASAAARAGAEAASLVVAGQVREAAWRVIAADAEVLAATQHSANLRQLVDDVRRRVDAGDLASADLLAAKADASAAQALHAGAQLQAAQARAHWRLVTGLETVPDAAEVPSDAAPPHPELLLAEQALERATRKLAVARLDRRDAPEVLLRWRQDSVAGAGSQSSLGVGVRFPLGGTSRNAPLLAAAQDDVDIAQADLVRTRERLAADQAIARQALVAALAQLGAERERASLLNERVRLIERSFKAGETSLPETLRAMAAAAQADAAQARQRAALGLAQARLNQSLGLLP